MITPPGPTGQATAGLCPACGLELRGGLCARCVIDSLFEPGPASHGAAGAALWPPAQLAHFRLERDDLGRPLVMGEGAMGITFRAFDEKLHLPVALKVIKLTGEWGGKMENLFLREARNAARIRHSHVASVLYLNDEPGQLYYAMELVPGQNLARWMEQNPKVDSRLALEFAQQIAEGLDAIHTAGIVHRDLKPANVMVAEATSLPVGQNGQNPRRWNLKIIDFGLARPVQLSPTETRTIGFRGTAAYASPEQCAERGDLDRRSDYYSLGCILFHLLTGSPPVNGSTHREVLEGHIRGRLPRSRIKALPPRLSQLLLHLLATDPQDRPADHSALRHALAEAAREAATTTITERPSPFTPRFRWPLAWGAAGLAAIGAWALVPTRFEVTHPPPPIRPTVTIAPKPHGIAVLPFHETPSSGPALAGALQHEVLSSLAMLKDLTVFASASIVRSKLAPDASPALVAEKLNAALAVAGEVVRVDERPTLRLVLRSIPSGELLWERSFEGWGSEINEASKQLAAEVAREAGLELTTDDLARIGRRHALPAAAALDHYDRARRILQSARNPHTDLDAAEEQAALAVRHDPKFARGYALLSVLHSTRYEWARDRTPSRLSKAFECANRAEALGGDLAEVHVAFGYCALRGSRDYVAAVERFESALRLEPRNTDAMIGLANALRRLGRWDQSETTYREASRLSPLDPTLLYHLTYTLLYRRSYRECAEELSRAEARLGPFEGLVSIRSELELHTLGNLQPLISAAEARTVPPKDPEIAIYEKVRAALYQRDFERARRIVEQSAYETLDSQMIYKPRSALLAEIAELAGDFATARQHWQQVLAGFPNLQRAEITDPRLGLTLARARAGIGDKSGALAAADQVLKLEIVRHDHLDLPYFEHAVAVLYWRVGEKAQAQALARSLLERPCRVSEHSLRLHPESAGMLD